MKYEEPSFDVIVFEKFDVITLSGGDGELDLDVTNPDDKVEDGGYI